MTECMSKVFEKQLSLTTPSWVLRACHLARIGRGAVGRVMWGHAALTACTLHAIATACLLHATACNHMTCMQLLASQGGACTRAWYMLVIPRMPCGPNHPMHLMQLLRIRACDAIHAIRTMQAVQAPAAGSPMQPTRLVSKAHRAPLTPLTVLLPVPLKPQVYEVEAPIREASHYEIHALLQRRRQLQRSEDARNEAAF